LSWSRRAAGQQNTWYKDIASGNGRYVAVGRKRSAFTGVVASSSDGLDWQTETSPETDLKGIAWGNGVFMAVGISHSTGAGEIHTSIDGKAWSRLAIPAVGDLSGIAFEAGRFVVVGIRGNLMYSE